MTRMTGPDCVVMCNLINTHTHSGDGGRDPIDEHRMGTGMDLRSVAKMGTGTKGTGTRVGSGMAKKRLRSARNR